MPERDQVVTMLWRRLSIASRTTGIPQGALLTGLLRRLVAGAPEIERAEFIGVLAEMFEPVPVPPPVQTIGDAPIEVRFRSRMTWTGRILDYLFNGRIGGPQRRVGFILLVFPFSDHGGRCNYLSNGADRRDVVVLLKEQLARFEGMPEQEGRA
jgi:hypothetical protein